MSRRLTPQVATAFVAFHAAMLAVAVAWFLALLFVGMVLGMSDLLPGSLFAAVFVVGPTVAGIVCWRFGTFLLRRPLHRWIAPTLILVALPIVAATSGLRVVGAMIRKYELPGPTSASGLQAIVAVRDAGFGVGADFYGDVLVVDANGTLVAEWKDPHGWGRREGPSKQHASMHWSSPKTLEFVTCTGRVEVTVP